MDDFDTFARSQWAAFVRAAYLLTGDRGRAEDLAQETLARTALAGPRAASRGTPAAYARRVMVNAHLSGIRRRRVVEVLHLHPAEPVTVATDRFGDRDELRRALQELPPRMRAAVVLRHYLDLSEQETATTLGCSVGNVKSLTSRGLARLREVMIQHPLPATRTETDHA